MRCGDHGGHPLHGAERAGEGVLPEGYPDLHRTEDQRHHHPERGGAEHLRLTPVPFKERGFKPRAGALQAGMRCGFSTIYVTGADHSWLKELWVDDNNVVHTDSAHFYDKNGAVSTPTSCDMYFWMNSFAIAFRSYKQVERYARKKGVDIYNVTPGSYIDAFRRKIL